ncbi:MAG: EpsI family protein [Acidobacteria bacterium]|nr:EpsI family protein [Acidobacteriota bacterium]
MSTNEPSHHSNRWVLGLICSAISPATYSIGRAKFGILRPFGVLFPLVKMAETTTKQNHLLTPVLIAAALVFLFASVLVKLGRDWWSDENYSHGLLVPFVIAFIIWSERDRLQRAITGPSVILGGGLAAAAIMLLLAGTVGAELFTQRIAFVAALIATVVYFCGRRILVLLAAPAALLLLSIPIPQIIFNQIAIPLQMWASQMAVWGIRLFEVPTLRKGNIIDILPRGATQTISLEVVEACSGIRSLMTLVTLALILGYFTRTDTDGKLRFGLFSGRDVVRTIILMAAAVPIAVLTNAARVSATGILTFYYGKSASEGTWHDASGWLVYIVALALLIALNFVVTRLFGDAKETGGMIDPPAVITNRSRPLPLLVVFVVGGLLVNWFAYRSEFAPPRQALSELSQTLGDWRQKGDEIKFEPEVENLLKTTDYTMREYTLADGRIANIYVGYYASQRTGETYHSPQNCLPGAGWVLSEPQKVEVKMADGRSFTANRYTLRNGIYHQVMLYWYEGRGRTESSEYFDKLNTVVDSVTRRRSDGAMVRVMTDVGHEEEASLKAVADLAAKLAEQLPPFVPE